MQRTLLSVIAVAVLLVGGFYAFNAYIYAQKQGDPNDVRSYRGTLSGEVVCLPHVDTGGPTTLECALGLKTDVGEHYALDLAAMSQAQPGLNTGERISANGLITPVEMLSSDHWRKYDIEGIFSVTDSLQKL
jgi:hypothetical protein